MRVVLQRHLWSRGRDPLYLRHGAWGGLQGSVGKVALGLGWGQHALLPFLTAALRSPREWCGVGSLHTEQCACDGVIIKNLIRNISLN